MARSHQGIRSPAHQLSDRPRPTSRILFARSPNLLTNCVTLKMTNCLTKPSGSQIACCTHCCRHHPLRRNATISDSVDTRYSCRNTLIRLQLLHACYTETHRPIRLLIHGSGLPVLDDLSFKSFNYVGLRSAMPLINEYNLVLAQYTFADFK